MTKLTQKQYLKRAYDINKWALKTKFDGVNPLIVEELGEKELLITNGYIIYKIDKAAYDLKYTPNPPEDLKLYQYFNPDFYAGKACYIQGPQEIEGGGKVKKFSNDNIEVYLNEKYVPKKFEDVYILKYNKPVLFDDNMVVLPAYMGPEYYTKKEV